MSDFGQIPQYLGFGPVCAAFCQTSDRAIRCPRYLTPRIVDGKICPVDSEVQKNWHTCGVPLALRRSQEDKILLWICHVSVLHPHNCIPRIDPRYTLLGFPHTSNRSCLPQLIRGIEGWPVHYSMKWNFYHSFFVTRKVLTCNPISISGDLKMGRGTKLDVWNRNDINRLQTMSLSY